MKLEQQVCSLELAKRLKELGVNQESLFAWDVSVTPARLQFTGGWLGSNEISAFTVAELGEDKLVLSEWNKNFERWGGWSPLSPVICYGDTEADARAAMLVHLIEQKLITLP